MTPDHVIRGTVEANTELKLQLFDGNYDTGYRIKKFIIYPNTQIGVGNDAHAVLYTASGQVASGLDWDWGSQYQVGWAIGAASGTNSLDTPNGFADPRAIIIEDLYIIANHPNAAGIVGYYIEFERVKMTEYGGVLQMIKQRP